MVSAMSASSIVIGMRRNTLTSAGHGARVRVRVRVMVSGLGLESGSRLGYFAMLFRDGTSSQSISGSES